MIRRILVRVPGRVAAAAALLACALAFPTAALVPLLRGAAPEDAWWGLTLLRAGLALDAALLLAWAATPADWFRGPGLPPAVTGLRLAPDGRPVERTGWAWAALVAIVAVGAALRLLGLGRDLWVDEVGTVVGYLRLPPWQVLYTYHTPNQHFLYSLLGSLSVSVLGESAWSVRLPAALFGTAGPLALYYLGRATTGAREAVLASALMAVSYHHVWFSQDARGYTTMLFWLTVGTGLFLRALTVNRSGFWVGYAVTMALAILAVSTAAFVLAGHVVAALWTVGRWPAGPLERRPLARRVVASAGLALLVAAEAQSLIVPRVVAFFRTANRAGLGGGVASPLDLARLFVEGLRAGFGVALLAALALLAWGWWSYWRQSPLVAAVAVLPPLFGAVAIVLLRYGAYPRAFLYVLPLALLATMRGAAALGDRAGQRLLPTARGGSPAGAAGGWALAGLLVVGAAAALPLNYRYPKQDYSGALAYVLARKAPGDRVCAVGMAGNVYRAYYAPTLDFPSSPAELAALRGPGHGVWVLYSFPRDMRLRFRELDAYVQREATRVAAFPGTVGDGTLYVMRMP